MNNRARKFRLDVALSLVKSGDRLANLASISLTSIVPRSIADVRKPNVNSSPRVESSGKTACADPLRDIP